MRSQSSRDRAEGTGSIEKPTKRPTNPFPSTLHRGRRKRGQSRGAYAYLMPMPPLGAVGLKQRS